MESTSKLADLTLVSKYYPVANYSYPRSRSHGQCSSRGSVDSNIGSTDLPPGLVDDRTDSETSAEDDYQYHAHATELWDTFWQSEAGKKQQQQQQDSTVSPRRQYPALIPSPQHRKPGRPQESPPAQSWPLPERPSHARAKRPMATYSPFPKPILLPARSSRPTPSWTSSRPSGMPQRPPRPENDLLLPCVSQSSPVQTSRPAIVRGHSLHTTRSSRPVTPQSPRFPPLAEAPRPTTSLEFRTNTGFESAAASMRCVSRSEASSPISDAREAYYAAPPAAVPKEPSQEPEPQSVFECDDSDTESSPTRSFFLFHKRAHSDRTSKEPEPTTTRRHRSRANTSPSRTRPQPEYGAPRPEMPHRKRQADVWGRMLGRRGR